MEPQQEAGTSLSRHAGAAPSGATLPLIARWWDEFGNRVERVIAEWSGSGAAASVTFTRQSPREISIAHRWASAELRLEGTRVRVVNRSAEPVRHNMGAATLVEFREEPDGLVAVAEGRPVSLDELVERVLDPVRRQASKL